METREQLLNHTLSSLGVIVDMGLKKDYLDLIAAQEQAKNGLEQAKMKLQESKDLLKTSQEVGMDAEGLKQNKKAVAEAKAVLEQAKKDLDSLKGKPEAVAAKAFDLFGTLLNQTERAVWNKITKEHTEDAPWYDLHGTKHEESCGKSWISLEDCVLKYLKTEFPDDTAEQQKYYLMNCVKKSAKVNIRHFTEHVETLNRYIALLQGLYNSPQATSATKQAKPFDDHDLANMLL